MLGDGIWDVGGMGFCVFFFLPFFWGRDFGCDVLFFFLKISIHSIIKFSWEVFFRVGICLLFFWGLGFGTFSDASFGTEVQ